MTVRVLVGDARERLRELPAESVQCVVTSPPYWNLRSYTGEPGMIGLEPTLDEHLAALVDVFREVRRVLRPDGCVFANYGDVYAANRTCQVPDSKHRDVGFPHTRGATMGSGFKHKDLMLLPARFAMALQADGWWLRSEIIWHKKSPMPESVTDRPTCAHEKVFLLTRAPHYFYDAVAVREEQAGSAQANGRDPRGRDSWATVPYGNDAPPPAKPPHDSIEARRGRARTGVKSMPTAERNGIRPRAVPPDREARTTNHQGIEDVPRGSRNLRNVWTLGPEPFGEAHFATFPTTLVTPCILAGTSEKGACPACGAPYVREADVSYTKTCPSGGQTWAERGVKDAPESSRASLGTNVRKHVETTGWAPSCGCDAGEPVPCVVLDPFGGAGTVGLVADRLQRDAILVEISREYARMAERRIRGDAGMFGDVVVA